MNKTSKEWQELYPEIKVLDPDGWDRENFKYSWFEEKISFEEYNKRIMYSTCKGINHYPLKNKGIKMEDEYIVINKTVLDKRIEELEKGNEAMWWKERDMLKQILSQSTPLIPEIEKSFDASKEVKVIGSFPFEHSVYKYNSSKDYISNLKLDI